MNKSCLLGISMHSYFSMLPLFFILLTEPVLASVINIDITTDLKESQIYNCGAGGIKCWHTSASITPQTVNLSQDTLVIQLGFTNSLRIRWETDGISAPYYSWDESIQVSASGSGFCCSSATYENSLSFLDVTGDLNFNPIEWTHSIGGSGGIVSQSYHSEMTNFTDSWFEFGGLVSTIGPYTSTSNGPYAVDRVHIFLLSGNFSYVSAIPEPATAWLIGSGLIGLLSLARRKKT